MYIKNNYKKLIVVIILLCLLLPALSLAVGESTGLVNPLVKEGSKEVVSFQDIIRGIITVALGLIGAISLVMFIYGGMLWITSRGKAKQIEQGKNTVTWAVIGIITVFASYAVLTAIFEALGKG